jgi:hypothetical protein
MEIKILKDVAAVFSFAILSSLLVSVAVTGGIEPQEVTSQSDIEDIFQIGGTGTQNQTQMAPANLTRADMEPVTSALNSARDSLLGNSSQDAYTSLNDADDALFRTALGQGSSAMTTIIEITQPMRNHIESAQNALLVGDLPRAMEERNSAEVELVRIIQGLPAGEEEPPAEEEEPPAEEEEPPAEEEEPPAEEEEPPAEEEEPPAEEEE